MGRADFRKVGDYNGLCDVCGFKYKFSQLRLRWDGLYTCKEDWNPRQPQDFVKGIADPAPPPVTRTDPAILIEGFITKFDGRQISTFSGKEMVSIASPFPQPRT